MEDEINDCYLASLEAEDAIEEAMGRANNLYRHLRRNVRQVLQHPAQDSPTKVRRHSGLQWRMHMLEKAHWEIRQAYEEILDVNRQLMDLLPKQAVSDRARRAGRKRLVTNAEAKAKADAMEAIKVEWLRMSIGQAPFMKDSKFARVMQDRFPVIENEGSIKNAIGRWRKESSS